MAQLDQLPGRLDLRLVAGRPFTFAVTCTGATVTSPTLTMISGQSDVVATGAPDVSVASNVITVAWSAADTTALAALKTAGRPAAFRYDLAAVVDGQGPYSLIARNFTIEPLGVATTGTQSTSATLAFEVGGANISLALSLSGGGAAWLSGSGAPSGATGDVGDWYINTANGDTYEKTGTSTWTSRVNLKGATGDAGADGAAGATGPAGPANVANYLYLYDNFI